MWRNLAADPNLNANQRLSFLFSDSFIFSHSGGKIIGLKGGTNESVAALKEALTRYTTSSSGDRTVIMQDGLRTWDCNISNQTYL